MQFLTTTTESYLSLFFTLALMLWSPSRMTPLFWRPVPTV